MTDGWRISVAVPLQHMKARGLVEVEIHSFLISALDEYEWSVPRSCHITPGIEPLETSNTKTYESHSRYGKQ